MKENGNQRLVVPADRFDIKDLAFAIIRKWPLILVGGLIGLTFAFVLNRYKSDVYELEAVLNVEQVENPLARSGVSLVVNTFGENKLDVKELVLKSVELNKSAARKLKWEVNYFQVGRLAQVELYENSPIKIEFDRNHYQIVKVPFFIEVKEDGFMISSDQEGSASMVYDYQTETSIRLDSVTYPSGRYEYDQWIEGRGFRFKVQKTANFDINVGTRLGVVFNTISSIAHTNRKTLNVNISEKANSTTMRLSARGNNLLKLSDLINTTVETLREHELERKNERARNTLLFIDEQINGIIGDLRNSEKNLESFRAQNLIIDLGAESQELLAQISDIDQQLTENLLLQRYYTYVIDFLQKNTQLRELSLPPLSGIEDPVVSTLIEKLVGLNGELTNSRLMLSSDNPRVQNLQNEITNTREALIQGANNALEHMKVLEVDIQNRFLEFQQKITTLPGKEQQFINIQRRYETYGRQYEMLLEKRAEAGILQASNLPDTQVIDSATAEFQRPISPNRSRNLLIGLIIGMALPVVVVIVLDSINNKIRSRKDIEVMTPIPILGAIGNSKEDGLIVVKKPKAVVAESFRGIVANLNFIIDDFKNTASGPGKLIMVTSSIGGEGKTFLSSNLASILAMSGLKTCLVGVDLRKPKILKNFDLESGIGLSSYLTDFSLDLPEITQDSGVNNLDVIGSGPIPPNPAELLGRTRYDDFLKLLKENYDVVVLDTPPIGLVADALQMLPKVDGTVYVTRYNYTPRELLGFINDQYENNNVSNVGILLNDVKASGAYGYGYGYGYDGYGYHNE